MNATGAGTPATQRFGVRGVFEPSATILVATTIGAFDEIGREVVAVCPAMVVVASPDVVTQLCQHMQFDLLLVLGDVDRRAVPRLLEDAGAFDVHALPVRLLDVTDPRIVAWHARHEVFVAGPSVRISTSPTERQYRLC